jgi:hypothetical protein
MNCLKMYMASFSDRMLTSPDSLDAVRKRYTATVRNVTESGTLDTVKKYTEFDTLNTFRKSL